MLDGVPAVRVVLLERVARRDRSHAVLTFTRRAPLSAHLLAHGGHRSTQLCLHMRGKKDQDWEEPKRGATDRQAFMPHVS